MLYSGEQFGENVFDYPKVFLRFVAIEIDVQFGPDILVIFPCECVDESCPLCFI